MMKIKLHGHNMAYEDIGQGIPIILIHGYPLGRKMWQPQLSRLNDTFRMIAPDLRGFGDSDPTPGPYTMDLLADDCAALLDQLAIKQPIIVCGLSMGGYVSFAFWRKFPQRVRGLILAATRALPDSPETAENRLKAIALAQKEGPKAITLAMLPKMLSPKTKQKQPELVTLVKNIILEASVTGITGALMGMRQRPDSTPTLSTIDVPTLIIRGDDDVFASMEETKAMKESIPNAQLIRVPEAAHLPNLEKPHFFNQAVKEIITNS